MPARGQLMRLIRFMLAQFITRTLGAKTAVVAMLNGKAAEDTDTVRLLFKALLDAVVSMKSAVVSDCH